MLCSVALLTRSGRFGSRGCPLFRGQCLEDRKDADRRPTAQAHGSDVKKPLEHGLCRRLRRARSPGGGWRDGSGSVMCVNVRWPVTWV